jgi:hypothetical protein
VVVEHLLRRRRALGEVDAVDVADVLAKPLVERLIRCCHCSHGRLDVVRLEYDDRDIAIGRALDPDSLAGDPGALARGLMVGASVSARAGSEGFTVGLGLTGQQRSGEGDGRRNGSL